MLPHVNILGKTTEDALKPGRHQSNLNYPTVYHKLLLNKSRKVVQNSKQFMRKCEIFRLDMQVHAVVSVAPHIANYK